MPLQTITAEQLRAEEQRTGAVEMLDVRTPVEFRELHVPQSRNVPLDQLRPRQVMEARNGGAERPLYLLCRTGNRASKAGQQFLDAGYANVVLVEGGVQAWEQAGLPVTRGKKAISLERQVRIVAGGLVLTGTLLGVFVHPYILALPAFVGAGLMFAGITDTCGMGMLLARMPWNRVACGKPAVGGDQSCSTASTSTTST